MKNPLLLREKIAKLYQDIYGVESLNHHGERFFALLEHYKKQRPSWLAPLDEQPSWFQQSNQIGMTLYIDLFSKDLKGLLTKVSYFKQLGIRYIHLMPLLKTREGNNDGGYAVQDYKAIEPKLGTMIDFEQVLKTYFTEGIYIAIDFVMNHTAKEHRWAQAALTGNQTYQEYYLMYDNETIPNEFNKTVPEVLPDIYPGNFTFYPSMKKHVFTSFSEFQWDLNFANPQVLYEVMDIFLFMANIGVAMIRLDAIPFIWKELGTTCRNLPRVHDFMQLFQLAKQWVAPGVAILGEAIVQPQEIYKYFGTTDLPECDVLYNAITMVTIWEALATRDSRLLAHELKRFPAPEHATWMNYLRCHDDIGWGFNEEFIRQSGRDPFLHKQYLIQFYNGSFPTSFARGKNYQENPKNGDARTNGTLSSLLGFEQANQEGHPELLRRAFSRFELVHRLLFALPGMPLLYSGDEWLQPNHYLHLEEEGKKDGRWLHRPAFRWDMVGHQNEHTKEKQAFDFIQKLIEFRNNETLFNHENRLHLISHDEPSVLAFKRGEITHMLCLFNFSEFPKLITLPIQEGSFVKKDRLTNKTINIFDGQIHLEPYESIYLTFN